jgi:hypothetical protein
MGQNERKEARSSQHRPPASLKARFLHGRVPLRRQNTCFFKLITDRDPDPADVSPISPQKVPRVESQVKEKPSAIKEENWKMRSDLGKITVKAERSRMNFGKQEF